MRKTTYDIIRAMEDRLSFLSKSDIRYFVFVIIGLMKKRIVENRVVIIDGFGVLLRRQRKYTLCQRYLEIKGLGKIEKTIAHLIKFYPHHDLNKMRDIIGKNFLKHLVYKNDEKNENTRIKKV